MPSNFNKESILQYAELNVKYSPNKVIETYGQATSAEITASGRPIEALQPISLNELEKYVSYSKKHDINFNYTINPSCISNFELTDRGIVSIKKFVMDLHSIGIDTFTIALPAIIEIIQSLNIKTHIVASAICDIDSPQTAIYYKKLNVDRIVLDSDIIRNFKTIKNISTVFGDNIELIVNSPCIKGCLFKIFHYNAIAHEKDYSVNGDRYYRKRCNQIKVSDKLHLLKTNWIRPEDIHYYNEIGVNFFKLAGRTHIEKRNPVKAAEHYLSGEYHGDLQKLIDLFHSEKKYKYYWDNKFLDGYVQAIWDCKPECTGVCDSCSLCSEYAEKSLTLKGNEA